MRKSVLSINCLLFCVVTLYAKPFSVASYNVQNLFDLYYQGSEYDAYIPKKRNNWNERTLEIKLNSIAEVLCELDADIVGLQEIENEAIFKRLIQRLERVGCGYRYGTITHKAGAPVQVALLSRFKILQTKELQVSPHPRVRNILEALIDTPGEPLRIFVNHWKSKARDGFESKRITYAKRLMRRINALDSTKPYIILGDLNSDYNAYLTLEKKLNDTNNITAINAILPTMMQGRLTCASDMIKAKTHLLYNPWIELPLKQRWSKKFYGKRGTPDHILLSPALFDSKGVDYVAKSFDVFRRAYLFTKKGYINAWQIKHGKHTGKGYSDHLPIIATFDAKPYDHTKNPPCIQPIKEVSIDALYTLEDGNTLYLLKDVAVILKRGSHGVIKQKGGRGIFVYGDARKLKEGYCYDLLVEGVETYKGLKEVTALYIKKEHGRCNINTMLWTQTELMIHPFRQNEVAKEIEGVYDGTHLHIGDKKIALYFKKARSKPPRGSLVKIKRAHLGFYNRPQIVIYRKEDIEVTQ